jgi:hypothetical protein
LGGRGRRISEFQDSLVYRVSSRTARAIQRNPVSKKPKNKNQKPKTKKKKKKKKFINQIFSFAFSCNFAINMEPKEGDPFNQMRLIFFHFHTKYVLIKMDHFL